MASCGHKNGLVYCIYNNFDLFNQISTTYILLNPNLKPLVSSFSFNMQKQPKQEREEKTEDQSLHLLFSGPVIPAATSGAWELAELTQPNTNANVRYPRGHRESQQGYNNT